MRHSLKIYLATYWPSITCEHIEDAGFVNQEHPWMEDQIEWLDDVEPERGNAVKRKTVSTTVYKLNVIFKI